MIYFPLDISSLSLLLKSVSRRLVRRAILARPFVSLPRKKTATSDHWSPAILAHPLPRKNLRRAIVGLTAASG